MQMNIETPATDLTTLAIKITEYSATAAALSDLRSKYDKVLFPVTTTAGMKDAIAARAELRNIRVGLEKMRKEIKEPALERCRLIDSEAKTITAALVALEDPIDAQIKAHEAKLAAEKAERERVEAARKAALQAKVDAIRNLPLGMDGETAAEIAVEIEALRQFVPSTEEFADYAAAAQEAANSAIVAMLALHERQVAKEAEAAELERQRVENARIAAEQEAERARLAAVAAELEAQAKAERDAAAARAAAELAEQQRVAAETKRQMEAQQAALAAERKAADDEMRAAREKLAADQKAFQDKLAAQTAEDQRRKDELAAAELAERLAAEHSGQYEIQAAMADAMRTGTGAVLVTDGEIKCVQVYAEPAVDETVVGLPVAAEVVPESTNVSALRSMIRDMLMYMDAAQIRAIVEDELTVAAAA